MFSSIFNCIFCNSMRWRTNCHVSLMLFFSKLFSGYCFSFWSIAIWLLFLFAFSGDITYFDHRNFHLSTLWLWFSFHLLTLNFCCIFEYILILFVSFDRRQSTLNSFFNFYFLLFRRYWFAWFWFLHLFLLLNVRLLRLLLFGLNIIFRHGYNKSRIFTAHIYRIYDNSFYRK